MCYLISYYFDSDIATNFCYFCWVMVIMEWKFWAEFISCYLCIRILILTIIEIEYEITSCNKCSIFYLIDLIRHNFLSFAMQHQCINIIYPLCPYCVGNVVNITHRLLFFLWNVFIWCGFAFLDIPIRFLKVESLNFISSI